MNRSIQKIFLRVLVLAAVLSTSGIIVAKDAETQTMQVSVSENYQHRLVANGSESSTVTWRVKAGNTLPSWLKLEERSESIFTLIAGAQSGYLDGVGEAAQFDFITDIEVDAQGNLFVTDQNNISLHASVTDARNYDSIRKITRSGRVSTVINAANWRFNVAGLTFDHQQNILFTGGDRGFPGIHRVTPSGALSRNIDANFIYPQVSSVNIQIDFSQDIVIDTLGNMFVSDSRNHRIFKITPQGEVSVFAGNDVGFADGMGTSARFNRPTGMVMDKAGNLFVVDKRNDSIRKITPEGVVTTFAGGTEGFADGNGTEAQFIQPRRIAIDGSGNLYVSDTLSLRKIDVDANVTTISSGRGYVDSVAVDDNGIIYIGARNKIEMLTPPGSYLSGMPTVSDQGTSSEFCLEAVDSQGSIDEQCFTFAVENENLSPIITPEPVSQQVAEDTIQDLNLTMVGLQDDSETVKLTLTADSGRLSSGINVSGLTVVSNESVFDGPHFHFPDPISTLDLVGPLQTINSFLATPGAIRFTTDKDSTADVTLSLKAFDGTQDSATTTTTISVTPVDDATSIAYLDEFTFEMESGVIQDKSRTIVLGNGETIVEPRFEYTETVNNVTLTIWSRDNWTKTAFTGGELDGSNVSINTPSSGETISFSQAVDIKSFVLENNDTLVSPGPDSITLAILATGGEFSGEFLTTGIGKFTPKNWNSVVAYRAVYSSPTAYASTFDDIEVELRSDSFGNDLTFIEDQNSFVDLSKVQFSDIDSTLITIRLTISSGTFGSALASGSTVGSGVVATRLDDMTISLTGSPADISSYLDNTSNISYQGAANVSGDNVATLTISSDNTSTGSDTLVSINIDISPVQDLPTINGVPASSVNEDSVYSFTPSAADADGDILTFSVTGAPAWLSLNTATGELSGTPINADVGTTGNIVLSVSDGTDTLSLPEFNITVLNVNDPPIMAQPDNLSLQEDDGIQTLTVTASDVDSNQLSWSVLTQGTLGVGNVTGTSATGTFSYIPNANANGQDTLVVSVSDGEFTSQQTLLVNIAPVNDPPVISGIPAVSVNKGNEYQFTPVASDIDGDILTYSASGLPSWLSLDTATGNLIGTPLFNDVGITGSIVLSVTDGKAIAALSAFTITVNNPNTPPEITGPTTLSISEDSGVHSVNFEAIDNDVAQLTWSLQTQSTLGTASVNSSAGSATLTYTPNANANGTESLVISLTDGEYSAEHIINVSVAAVNDSPQFETTEPLVLSEDGSSSMNLTAIDIDSTLLTFSITSSPQMGVATLTSNSNPVTLVYTPNANVNGSDTIGVTVSDGELTATQSISVTINPVNDAPQITGSPSTSVLNGELYSFFPTVTDIDSEELSFSINKLPRWAIFDTATGGLTGIPSRRDISTRSNIVITVSDGELEASLTPFNILVEDSNLAPVIEQGDSVSVAMSEDGQPNVFSLTLSAVDENDDAMTWFVTDAQLGSSSVSNNGVVSYTPQADANGQDSFSVSVSDGIASDSILVYVLIEAVNDAPKITGTPASRLLDGEEYSFTPTATDIDSEELSFHITNPPTWAIFDSATGGLMGVPSRADIGTSSNIVITVSDGELEASLTPFNILVEDSNVAPIIEQGDTISVTMSEDGEPNSFSLTLFASDENDDDLTWSVTDAQLGSSNVSNTGVVSYTPQADANGQDSFSVSVSDGIASDSILVSVLIEAVNDAPQITGSPSTRLLNGEQYNFTPSVSDVDGDNLSFNIINAPLWATFNSMNGNLEGVPSRADIGTSSNIVITVSDGELEASLTAFNILVEDSNVAPIIEQGDTISVTMSEDGVPSAFALTLSAEDDNGDALSWSVSVAQHGNVGIDNNGVLAYEPEADFNGQDSFSVSVSDGIATDSIFVDVTVQPVNDAPRISGQPSPAVNINGIYSFIPEVTDIDSDNLQFSIENSPGWAQFDNSTGALTGTPDGSNLGLFEGIVISVTDGELEVSLDTFSIEVFDPSVNVAPVVSDIAVDGQEDQTLDIGLLGEDRNGDTLVYSVTAQPANGSVIIDNNIASYIPNGDFNGEDSFTYIGSDGVLNSEPATVTVNLSPVNDAPIISGQPVTRVLNNAVYNFQPEASDVENDSLTFSVANAPAWLSIDNTSGLLSGAPDATDIGFFENILISVSDGQLDAALDAFSIEVVDVNANTAPVAQDTALSTNEDVVAEIQLQATDSDGDVLTYVIQESPAFGSIEQRNSIIVYTPKSNVADVQDSFTFIANDGVATSAVATVTIGIFAVNDAPVITGTPMLNAKVNQEYRFVPVASDIENDTLTFSIVNQPRWTDFDRNTGILSGTPVVSDSGTFTGVTISVSDGSLTSELEPFSIEVQSNNAPMISGVSVDRVEVGRSYSFTPSSSDADGDELSFSVSNAPSWTSFDTSRGTLSGMPTAANIGTTTGIVISVTDGTDSVSLPVFDLEVCEACGNVAPIINGVPATSVTEGFNYSFVPTANDSNNDELIFSIENQPAWTAFDSATGALTGVPGAADLGTYSNIVISVSDSLLSASLPAFAIVVAEFNDAPTISGTPTDSVFQDEEYAFTPTASDADGDVLTFNVQNQPGWASFNPRTGTLRGVPVATNIGLYEDIIVSVSDANQTVSLPTFSIQVVARNTPPQISGTPRAGIVQGKSYQFIPVASDADGDELIFTVSGLPKWLSLDTSTGTLSGVPQSTDLGITGDIVLSVSDGLETVVLPAFNITVTAANAAPVAIDSSVNVNEDTPLVIMPQASDPDGNVLLFTLQQEPQNGVLQIDGEIWTYLPNANFTGADSLAFSASDGELESAVAIIAISVDSVNDAPVAEDDDFTLEQADTGIYSLDVLANDNDVDIITDADSLTIQGAQADFATVAVVNNQLEFNAGSSFVGSVGLVYALRDSQGATAQANVTLTIEPAAGSVPPVITVPQDVTVNANGLFTEVELGLATATDSTGNNLPVSLVNNNTLFTPGAHTVFWQAEDSFGSIATAAQNVTVNPLVSVSQDQKVSEGSTTSVSVILNGDAPQYPYTLTYTVSGSAQAGVDHNASDGSVTLDSGREALINIDILSDDEVESDETLIINLDSSFNLSARSQSVITISELNIAPQIQLQVTQGGENRLTVARDDAEVIVRANVVDANPADSVLLEWSSLNLMNLSASQESFVFDPNQVTAGIYQVTLFASDNGSPVLSSSADVFIEVVDTLVVLSETEDTDGDLIPDAQEGFADSDGDGIPDYLDAINDCNVVPEQAETQNEFLVESEPGVCMRRGLVSALNASNGLGVLSGEDAADGRGRPAPGTTGIRGFNNNGELPEDTDATNIGGIFDFILYDLRDDVGNIVLPQKQPIPADAVYRKYRADIQQWVFFSSDERNQIFSTHGSRGVCPPPGSDVWTPGLTEGDWCVQLQLEDGGANDDDGIVNGAVMDPGGVAVILNNNQLPRALDDTVEMAWNTSLEIEALDNDTDPDGDSLQITSAQSSFGDLVITQEQNLVYTPPQNYAGSDVIDYAISDGKGGVASAQIAVTVVGNRAPGAVPDSAQTDDKTAIEINVLENDIDVDGDELTITRVVAETGQVVITEANTLVYTPLLGFDGLDIITYEVSDANGASSLTTVSVLVDGNQAPVAMDDSVITAFETSVTVNVLSNDMDVDGDSLTITAAAADSGEVVINDDQSLTYTPDAGFSGVVEVQYTISDGSLSSEAVLLITVETQPGTPVAPTSPVEDSDSGGSSDLLTVLIFFIMIWRRKYELGNQHLSR